MEVKCSISSLIEIVIFYLWFCFYLYFYATENEEVNSFLVIVLDILAYNYKQDEVFKAPPVRYSVGSEHLHSEQLSMKSDGS